MLSRSVDVALGVWFRCDYGMVGLMVGRDLLGGLFQPWWLRDCVHTHCTAGEIPMVFYQAGLVETQNRTKVQRLGLAEQLCWIWYFLEITAEIWPQSSATPLLVEDLRCKKIAVIRVEGNLQGEEVESPMQLPSTCIHCWLELLFHSVSEYRRH